VPVGSACGSRYKRILNPRGTKLGPSTAVHCLSLLRPDRPWALLPCIREIVRGAPCGQHRRRADSGAKAFTPWMHLTSSACRWNGDPGRGHK
jgi:hypothetical protein